MSTENIVKVGVGVMVRNEKGEVLMGRRGPEAKNEKGKWNFPGGELEFGETVFGCGVRETMEEFGIEVRPLRLLKVIDHIIPDEGQHWVNPIIEAKLVKGEPKIMEPHKIDDMGWFAMEKWPESLTINIRQLYKELLEGSIKLG